MEYKRYPVTNYGEHQRYAKAIVQNGELIEFHPNGCMCRKCVVVDIIRAEIALTDYEG